MPVNSWKIPTTYNNYYYYYYFKKAIDCIFYGFTSVINPVKSILVFQDDDIDFFLVVFHAYDIK